MSEHTEGPWEVREPLGAEHVDVVDKERRRIAVIAGYYPMGPRAEDANARLIAAAPDLYAVVEELIDSAEYWSEYFVPLGIVDRMKAALAKAKGESDE